MRVAIIGGGPSGLTTLRYMADAHSFFPLQKPIDVRLFEASDHVGGVFYNRSYEEGELVSSRFLTAFSDFRPYASDPDFLSTNRYLEYLEDYISHFRLWQNISLNTSVVRVRRRVGGGHIVTYRPSKDTGAGLAETQWECDVIAVCSGLHETPNVPYLPGIEKVPEVIHSADFKERKQFGEGKSVLVLGTGETGTDIAHLAITSPTKKVVLCTHSGFFVGPKIIPNPVAFPKFKDKAQLEPDLRNIPTDASMPTLFEAMYVHPLLRDSLFHWDWFEGANRSLAPFLQSGSWEGFHQHTGAKPGRDGHPSKVFFNKSWLRLAPYVSPPLAPKPGKKNWTRAHEIAQYIMHTPLADAGRYLDLGSWPSHIDGTGRVHFTDNGRSEYEAVKDLEFRPDMVVFATGYSQSMPFFAEQNALAPSNMPEDRPYPMPADTDVRSIWRRDDPTIGLIGFVRPGLGAIPPLSEIQAQLFTLRVLGRLDDSRLLPEDEWHYRLLHQPTSRIQYGVDHDAYTYQLGKDMGSAIGVTDLLPMGWKGAKDLEAMRAAGHAMLANDASRSDPPGLRRRIDDVCRFVWIWALGPCYTVKFRMKGPWKWDGAEAVLVGELWETISRRKGILGTFTLGIVTVLVLGIANLVTVIYALWRNILAAIGIEGAAPWKKGEWIPEDLKHFAEPGGRPRLPEEQHSHGDCPRCKALDYTGMSGDVVVAINGVGAQKQQQQQQQHVMNGVEGGTETMPGHDGDERSSRMQHEPEKMVSNGTGDVGGMVSGFDVGTAPAAFGFMDGNSANGMRQAVTAH